MVAVEIDVALIFIGPLLSVGTIFCLAAGAGVEQIDDADAGHAFCPIAARTQC